MGKSFGSEEIEFLSGSDLRWVGHTDQGQAMGDVDTEVASNEKRRALGRDFQLFFSGQLVSNLGNAVTDFALPLLVYEMTGSALNLGLTLAVTMAPYLLFGLVIGAWMDRVDRKRMMVITDVLRGLVLMIVPGLALADSLTVEWIYVVSFVASALGIAFDAGQFAAIPQLVSQRDIVTANGRIRASYSITAFLGAPLAAFLMQFVPLEAVVMADAVSFVFSSTTLLLIRRSFNAAAEAEEEAADATTIRQDVIEGLRYVFTHPILRNLAILMVLINFLTAVIPAQIIHFGQTVLGASEQEVSFLVASASAGVVLLSLSAGPVRRRFSFSVVTMGSLAGAGLLVSLMSMLSSVWAAIPVWGLAMGLTVLFNICTGSLRQQITPPALMSRVASSAEVLAWSFMPLGVYLGSLAVEETGRVELVYRVLGVIMAVLAIVFYLFSPLGRAAEYTPAALPTRLTDGVSVEEGPVGATD